MSMQRAEFLRHQLPQEEFQFAEEFADGLIDWALPFDAHSRGALSTQVGIRPAGDDLCLDVPIGMTGIPFQPRATVPPGDITVLVVTRFNELNSSSFGSGVGASMFTLRAVGSNNSPTLAVTNTIFSGSQMRAVFGRETDGTAVVAVNNQIITTGRDYAIAGAANGNGSSMSVAVNGSVQLNQFYAVFGSFDSNWSGTPQVGSHLEFATVHASQRIRLYARWRRRVPDEALQRLTSDPRLLFRPRSIWVPVTAAAPTTPTLSDAAVTDLASTSARPRVTLTF